MNPAKLNKQKISRKKFLQISGSAIAGGTILGTTGYLLGNRTKQLNNIKSNSQINENALSNATFQSPYKLVASFSTPQHIKGFELYQDKMVVAMPNNIHIYNISGKLQNSFAVDSNLRDIAVEKDLIYLLFPTRIKVYHFSGELKNEWKACSDDSDYCSLAVSPNDVFVTDATNKNICQYTLQGNLVRFIESPHRFIIPSYSFGITYANESIYCSNSGKHRVERYSVHGKYLGSFGEAGDSPGHFCGCCNPVYITHTSTGEIITSEKGKPRVSCYDSDGNFRNILLDDQLLGGGNMAYDIKVNQNKIYVAGNKLISTFQYDKMLAARTRCSTCGIHCPLREGITI